MYTILQLILAATLFALTLAWVAAHIIMGHIRTLLSISTSLTLLALAAALVRLAWHEHKHPDRL